MLKIKEGWRKLRAGEVIQKGDEFISGNRYWKCYSGVGKRYKENAFLPDVIVIRKKDTSNMKYKVGEKVTVTYHNFEGQKATIVKGYGPREVEPFNDNILYLVRLEKEIAIGLSHTTFAECFLTKEEPIMVGEHEVIPDGKVAKIGCQRIDEETARKIVKKMGWTV